MTSLLRSRISSDMINYKSPLIDAFSGITSEDFFSNRYGSRKKYKGFNQKILEMIELALSIPCYESFANGFDRVYLRNERQGRNIWSFSSWTTTKHALHI